MLSIFVLFGDIDMLSAKRDSYSQLIVIFLATILGCIVTNVWMKQSYDVSVFDLSTYALSGSKASESLKYSSVLIKRIEQMAVIILAIKVFQIDRVINLLTFLFGFVLGFLLSVQSYYLGIKGVFVVIFTVIPQFLFYYAALLCVKKYIRSSDDKKHKIQFAICYVMFFLFGILFECNFSEKIFGCFYQYMVTV